MRKFLSIAAAFAVATIGFAGQATAAPAPPGARSTTTVKSTPLSATDCALARRAQPKSSCVVVETDTMTVNTVAGQAVPAGARAIPLYSSGGGNDPCVPGVSYWRSFHQNIQQWPSYSVAQDVQMGDDPCSGTAWTNDQSHRCYMNWSVGIFIGVDGCWSWDGNGWSEAYMHYTINYLFATKGFHGAIVLSGSGFYNYSKG